MGDVVDAAADRAARPGIHQIKGQGRVHRHRRMKAGGRLPGLVAHPRDRLPRPAGLRHGHPAAVAGDDVTGGVEAFQLHLQAFDGAVDVAHGAADGPGLAHDVPRLQRLADLHRPARDVDRAAEGEAELALRLEPGEFEVVALAPQVVEHTEEVLPHEVGQHEAVVQGRAPAHQRAVLRLAPEPRHEGAQQQLLGERHARVGRHFEGAELDEAEATRRAVRREQLVDADLGAVGVAGDVDEQVAEQPVDEPGRRLGPARPLDHRHGDLELVERVVARLVDARGLAGGADEETGEQVGQRGVALPVEHEALQEVRPAQERAVLRRRAAQHHMVAAAGAAMAAVDHELVGAEARQARLIVDALRHRDRLAPGGGRLDVDLDDAGSGVTFSTATRGSCGGW